MVQKHGEQGRAIRQVYYLSTLYIDVVLSLSIITCTFVITGTFEIGTEATQFYYN